ncbi:CATRA system-associated protein [Streptomyces sp. NPDC091219]|uniref:CATRA system-associated protein n=1 Tax=Streptomyces sp. NPDC091219 TaxID=3155193 RepID=UPI00344E1692
MNDEALDRAAEDAVTVLTLMPEMEASAPEWAQVERILATAMEPAIDRRDASALITATRDVKDLTGPYHGPARIGEQPPGPPPQPVLERIPKIMEKIGRLQSTLRA